MAPSKNTSKLKAPRGGSAKRASATLRSTSGAGFEFEDLISAWQLVKALSGEQAPGIDSVVTQVQAQVSALGWGIDDLLLTAQATTAPRRLAMIRDTADPSKAAVAARHQQERLQRDVYSHVAAQSELTNMAAPPPADPAQAQTPDFQKARAHREHYLARMAEMEFRKAQGELVEISFVQKAAFETARSLNHALMSLSPQLAPQLAALSDPWEVERQLTAAIRQRLNEAAQVSNDDFGLVLDESCHD